MDLPVRGPVDLAQGPCQANGVQGPDAPTFRPTVWPADPPATPRVPRFRVVEDAETGGLEVVEPVDSVELPPDFVLRELMTLPLVTVEDVLDLTSQWGLAAGTGGNSFEYFIGGGPGTVERDLRAWQSAGRATNLLHPGAVAVHIKTLRTLSRHLLAHLEEQCDKAIIAAWEPEGPAVPQNLAQAWIWFEGYINRGLSAFTVHVRLLPTYEVSLSRPAPNLYNACCLQQAQYLAGGEKLKRCANDRCRQPFTVHRTPRRQYADSTTKRECVTAPGAVPRRSPSVTGAAAGLRKHVMRWRTGHEQARQRRGQRPAAQGRPLGSVHPGRSV